MITKVLVGLFKNVYTQVQTITHLNMINACVEGDIIFEYVLVLRNI
jgi:hypothetical protein